MSWTLWIHQKDFIAQIIKDDAWKIGPAMVLFALVSHKANAAHPTESDEHRRQQVSQVPHQV